MSEYESKASWRDPNWKYVPANKTDVSKTFDRIRREMKAKAQQDVEVKKSSKNLVEFKKQKVGGS